MSHYDFELKPFLFLSQQKFPIEKQNGIFGLLMIETNLKLSIMYWNLNQWGKQNVNRRLKRSVLNFFVSNSYLYFKRKNRINTKTK